MNAVCPYCGEIRLKSHQPNSLKTVQCWACGGALRQALTLAEVRELMHSSAQRVANTVLACAVREDATAVCLCRNDYIGSEHCIWRIATHCEIAGEWHERMVWPGYIWLALKSELLTRAEAGLLIGKCKEAERSFALQLLSEGDGVLLTLR